MPRLTMSGGMMMTSSATRSACTSAIGSARAPVADPILAISERPPGIIA
jgi:hypothetical protein